MKKTFTQEEFDKLTHRIVDEQMKLAEEKGMKGPALMVYALTYMDALAELNKAIFDDITDTVEILKENI